MERRPLKEFHKDLNWSTRIYTLMTIATIVLSIVFDAWSYNWTFTILVAIAIVLFVETFAIYFHKYPKTLRIVRLLLFLALLAMLLIGAF